MPRLLHARDDVGREELSFEPAVFKSEIARFVGLEVLLGFGSVIVTIPLLDLDMGAGIVVKFFSAILALYFIGLGVFFFVAVPRTVRITKDLITFRRWLPPIISISLEEIEEVRLKWNQPIIRREAANTRLDSITFRLARGRKFYIPAFTFSSQDTLELTSFLRSRLGRKVYE